MTFSKGERLKKAIKSFGLVALGFALYPMVFVPLGYVCCPSFMEWWIYRYADYLRLLGF
jgi:hypothetical protein